MQKDFALTDKISTDSHLSIALKFPIRTFVFIATVWGLFFFACLALLASSTMDLSFVSKVLLICLLPLLAFIHLYLLKIHWEDFHRLIWNGEDWFLAGAHVKERIELTSDTRIFGLWVLLCYRSQGLLTKQLWLVKEMVSDTDYRDMSRTLRFLTVPKVGDTNL